MNLQYIKTQKNDEKKSNQKLIKAHKGVYRG